MAILLHCCCGPCATFPVKWLKEHGFEVTGYHFNPNIHPYREFKHRLETLKEYANKVKLDLIVDDSYLLEEFLKRAIGATNGRCSACYEMRLRQAARVAKEQGFEQFSTTLLVSPYQKHELIKQIAEQVAEEEGIGFFYTDFRSGYKEGVEISKELELYRQPYCGCIFSEKDRYWKPRKGKV